jgi:hypothetical protein
MLTTTAAGRTWDYSHVIGCASVSDRGFRIPLAVKCATDGTLFVLNRGGERPVDDGIQMDGQRIGMLTLDEVYLGEFATGEFVWPVDLALDTEGLVYVSDQFRRTVSVYKRDGERMREWSGPESGPGLLDGPAGLVFDSEDDLYVADGDAHRVHKFTKNGEYLDGWGEQGVGDGQFERPWGICIDTIGDIYVVDWGNDRVQKFSPDGKFLMSFGGSNVKRRNAPTWDDIDLSDEFPGSLNHPACVAVDSQGDVYVTDWGNKRVQIYEPNGQFITSLFGETVEWSKWAQQDIEANSDIDKAMRRVSPERLAASARFLRPTGIAIDPEDRIIVAESHHYRLQVYQKMADYVEPQFNL